MKKRNRALTISLLAMASILASCNEDYTYPDANWKEGKVVEVGGKTYKYDEIYALMNGKKASATAYYTTAKNVLAQLVTPITESMRSTVDSAMDELHTTWKNNAKTNSTSYKEEQEKTFDSENVENEDQLIAKKLAAQQNEINTKNFYSEVDGDFGESTTDGRYYISEEQTKKFVEDNAPYHVSHILVKVDATSDGQGYWKGEISSDNAKHIGNVLRMLTSGNSFGDVAQITSDDSSKSNYGELSSTDGDEGSSGKMIAMTTSTSYVNEFKLGIYAYDAFINPNVTAEAKAKALETLRVPTEVESSSVKDDISNTINGQGKAFGIPVSEAFTMAFQSETTKKLDGSDIKDATATSYPRNIIFNNYFNNHGVNFIYNDAADYDAKFLEDAKTYAKAMIKSDDVSAADKLEFGKVATVASPSELADIAVMADKYDEYLYVKGLLDNMSDSCFSPISDSLELVQSGNNYGSSIGTGLPVLHDDNGNPIIVTRAGTSSYQGIHFIVVNNDPFTADGNGGVENKYQYYRVNMPSSSSTKDAESVSYKDHPSFVNFLKADKDSTSTYNTRITAIKDVLKSADSNTDYLIWDSNVAAFKTKYKVDFSEVIGTEVFNEIQNMIKSARETSDRSGQETLDSSWETYVNQLGVQEQYSKRTLPNVCVSFFEAGNLEGDGGECHVTK